MHCILLYRCLQHQIQSLCGFEGPSMSTSWSSARSMSLKFILGDVPPSRVHRLSTLTAIPISVDGNYKSRSDESSVLLQLLLLSFNDVHSTKLSNIPRASKHCSDEWQDICSNCSNNKLLSINMLVLLVITRVLLVVKLQLSRKSTFSRQAAVYSCRRFLVVDSGQK